MLSSRVPRPTAGQAGGESLSRYNERTTLRLSFLFFGHFHSPIKSRQTLRLSIYLKIWQHGFSLLFVLSEY